MHLVYASIAFGHLVFSSLNLRWRNVSIHKHTNPQFSSFSDNPNLSPRLNGDNTAQKRKKRMTPKLPPMWIMISLHLQAGLSPYAIPRRASQELKGPKTIAPFQQWTLEQNGHRQAGTNPQFSLSLLTLNLVQGSIATTQHKRGRKDDSKLANYGLASPSSWSKSKCNSETCITRIKGPKEYCILSPVNPWTEWAQTSRPAPILTFLIPC